MIRTIRKWLGKEDGVAAVEFALVFPVLFVMLVGVWDVGNAILANRKMISATNIVVDLIGRQESVTDSELAQAFQAGTLAMAPFDTSGLVFDVLSVVYDEDDDPTVYWQEDSGGGSGDATLVGRTAGLGSEGGGAIVVQTTYDYEPLFAGFALGDFTMRERLFSRGRQSTLVDRE